jgi:hypothetical protein
VFLLPCVTKCEKFFCIINQGTVRGIENVNTYSYMYMDVC